MIITVLDFLLLPVYLFMFYAMAKSMAKPYGQTDMRKYLLTAFWLRMFGSIAYTLVVQFYYGYGDSITYYNGSSFFVSQIMKDASNINYLFVPFKETEAWYNSIEGDPGFSGYFAAAQGNMVMRISAIFSFLSFHKFMIISLFFGFFSFAGQWRLFTVFNELNGPKDRKLLAYAVLYTPSIWFWGSGLMKDSICLGGIGFMLNILYRAYQKKKLSIINILVLLVIGYIVMIIKSYILAVVVASLAVMLFAIFLKKIKNPVFKFGFVGLFAFAALIVLATLNVTEQILEITQESVDQIKGYQSVYSNINDADESSKAGFASADVAPTIGGLVSHMPFAIFTCLYRPFLWESRKITILFTSLESMVLLYYTLYLMRKTRFFGFFRMIFNSPPLTFCFILSMLFSLIIGFTTFNFGTMIRYKIILLPFFYFMLVNMYSRTRPAKNEVAAPSPEPVA